MRNGGRIQRLGIFFLSEVIDGNGDEVGCLENLEVTFDVVVAFGSVDDGFGRSGVQEEIRCIC